MRCFGCRISVRCHYTLMCKYRKLTEERDALLTHFDKLVEDATSVGNPRANAIALITAIRKFASIQCILSDQADLQTRRIVRLTWALLFFTVALFAVAVIQTKIMFKQDADAHTHQVQASQYEQTPSTNK